MAPAFPVHLDTGAVAFPYTGFSRPHGVAIAPPRMVALSYMLVDGAARGRMGLMGAGQAGAATERPWVETVRGVGAVG